jgi:hypothetical protein
MRSALQKRAVVKHYFLNAKVAEESPLSDPLRIPSRPLR